jgi:hypothetical protein
MGSLRDTAGEPGFIFRCLRPRPEDGFTNADPPLPWLARAGRQHFAGVRPLLRCGALQRTKISMFLWFFFFFLHIESLHSFDAVAASALCAIGELMRTELFTRGFAERVR